MFFPTQKNNPLHFQNQGYIGIFMSLRERKRERERERERGRGRESAGDYISKPPGQNEKSANYTGKSGIVCS
jgi:hypothetical protein